MLKFAALVAVLSLLLPAQGKMLTGRERYFSIGHHQQIRTRLDPIISPGKVSGHVHAYAGANVFSNDESYTSVRDAECSSSFIQDDKSGYWVPTMYYKYRNGTYTAIQGDGLVMYWKYAFNDHNETFQVIPDDFRMVAGNISRDSLAENTAISFECVGDGHDYKTPWMPSDLSCPIIRAQAFFPNCWNGVDSYKEDGSHVAYPIGNEESGPCPAGYKRMPSLFVEAYYHVKDTVQDWEWYPGSTVLANGDNHGYSYHADFLNGWPSGMLVDAYEKCGEKLLQGTVEGCSVFEASRNQAKADNCFASAQIIAEPIGYDTPLLQLPGNNPEFNSSALSSEYPKKPRSDYTEMAQVVSIQGTNGICAGVGDRVCRDYVGGTSGSSGVGNTESMSATEVGMSTSETGGMGMSQTKGVSTTASDMSMFKGTTNTASPLSTSTSKHRHHTTSTVSQNTSVSTSTPTSMIDDSGVLLGAAGASQATVTVTVTTSNTACMAKRTARRTRRGLASP